LLGSVVVEAAIVDRVPSRLPGGTRVYVTDLVSGLLLAVALARLLRLRRFDKFHRWLLRLGVLLLVSLARGAAAFGMQPSVADFREYLIFAGVAAAAVREPLPTQPREVQRADHPDP
jgi:hypothetical protein